MFTAIQLAVCVMLGITTIGYSMDSAVLTKGSKKKEDAVYRAICERRIIKEDTMQDLKSRARAVCRIYATREYGDQLMFYEHGGMKHGYLRSPEGDRYGWVGGNKIAIRHETPTKLYSITIIQMPQQVISCAFNNNGTVFASATADELYVSDVVCNNRRDSQLRLERSIGGIQHIALSDSGNRVVVGAKSSRNFRFKIIDTQSKQLLYDLPAFSSPDKSADFCFFYMMNEDIIATCLLSHIGNMICKR